MKILFHYEASPSLIAKLHALRAQGLDIETCAQADDGRFYDLVQRADVLWHWLRPVTEDVLQRGSHLRLVQKIGVGVNTIDLEAAKRRQIAVCNMPGANSRAVAEMTLLLILGALRRVTYLDARVRTPQGWHLPPETGDSLHELNGLTVGLLGFGAVPRLLAPWLRAMGAKIIATARSPKNEPDVEFVPFEQLLARADVVSLHVPLTPETQGLFSGESFAAMKPGAVFVNTARGGLVDEAALIEALRCGRIAAAGLDVFAEEPVPANNVLLAFENVIATPHVAGLSTGTFDRSIAIAAENCRRLAAGEALLHQVA